MRRKEHSEPSVLADSTSTLYKRAKALSRPVLERLPLNTWMRLFPQEFITLAYHMVSDRELDHVKYYSYKTSKMFEADVMYVVENYSYMKRVDLSEFEPRK